MPRRLPSILTSCPCIVTRHIERGQEIVCTSKGDVWRGDANGTQNRLLYLSYGAVTDKTAEELIGSTHASDAIDMRWEKDDNAFIEYHVQYNRFVAVIQNEIEDVVKFDSVTTVVDSVNVEDSLKKYTVAYNQIAAADVILINKKDLVTDEELSAINETLIQQDPIFSNM